ncbi:hypothetical protein [Tropicimonas marinistellae]|uniref:hypothetical protein n=1 Tax=Tropicimonas marinistellae TaxID=1739787 RepID=UPI000836494F|nr:hypothetical protein [Tropicimonas marinistellae]
MSIADYPVTLLPIEPYAKKLYQAVSGTGLVAGGKGISYSIDMLMETAGVEMHRDGYHKAYFIVANFLDRPITMSEFYEGHGWQYLQPGIVDIPVKAPDTPVTRVSNMIPGQTESMIPDTPDDPTNSTISDVDSFGIGVFQTGKDGMFRGTEAGISFTTADSRVSTTMAIAACITEGGGGLYHAVTMDMQPYGSLQGFHDATVDDSKTIATASKNGISILSSATQAFANNGGLDIVNPGEDGPVGVFTFFIGPKPA